MAKSESELDVRHVAGLARIALTDAEAALLQPQLEAMLAFVDELHDVDVAGVEVAERASEGGAGWREDEPQPGLSREAALANAPQIHQGQFMVPKVIE
ncbi:MAG: Asp-tRNA(Asn)/Glu-tRNA(Gln) amidotransferase subunit GatC [Lentisphaerae bacterium]|jgi:aspartyl-tRNA(Asn)/glutamyl-tRNA(Gln) amidotransferase subunit C|nr:Asp-tRNA(Asn)/Glu-tRNA(Gln) amidotransferase subunit GatC [Lentisphaerota bacterium]